LANRQRWGNIVKSFETPIDKKKMLAKAKDFQVPTNLPVLQLKGDMEKNPKAPICETVDQFLDMSQHTLDMDAHREACLISSLQHSLSKCSWYKEKLMLKGYTWEQAKLLIKNQFGGQHTQSYYLEKLNTMEARRNENPLKFVEHFVDYFHRAQVKDCVAYGSMILTGLLRYHSNLVMQIRATYAATNPDQNLNIDVAYISRIAPMLHIEEPLRCRKKEESISTLFSLYFSGKSCCKVRRETHYLY
jgi:hypothetical protein